VSFNVIEVSVERRQTEFTLVLECKHMFTFQHKCFCYFFALYPIDRLVISFMIQLLFFYIVQLFSFTFNHIYFFCMMCHNFGKLYNTRIYLINFCLYSEGVMPSISLKARLNVLIAENPLSVAIVVILASFLLSSSFLAWLIL